MKKLNFTLLFLLFFTGVSQASHITGGEMYYDNLGAVGTNNLYRYRITLVLFRDENCFNCADMPGSISIGVFNNDNSTIVGGYQNLGLDRIEFMEASNISPCITNPPNLRYSVGYYILQIDLPLNTRGYTATYQTCCRINGIQNVSDMAGATYSTTIPGGNNLPIGISDNSPRFSKSISVICFNRYFELDFSATDPDNGDSLVYSMCSAYNGGSAQNASYATPAPPPYGPVGYIGGFSGRFPLGTQVDINPQTGIISGIAPGAGRYVITVCVDTYKNGIFIGTHFKDFILTVAPCDLAGAQLDPEYITCDGFNYTFTNRNQSPLNETYYWDFGVPGITTDTSTLENPTYTYPDTGVFTIKLVINRGLQCSDSATSIIKVFPGFFPEFSSTSPTCKGVPVQFTDNTVATYGNVNFWRWDFGIAQTTTDISSLENPEYIYTNTGTYTTTLIVASNKGCRDTITRQVSILDNAPFSIEGDTLICSIDTVQLNTVFNTNGVVTWSPNYNISNVNSPNPFVSPDVTTTYVASFLDEFGCAASDSITIRVIDFVQISLPSDTSICLTDDFVMPLETDGVIFTWTPATFLDDPSIKNPLVTATSNISYTVRSEVGGCFAEATINVNPVPYPVADAGPDQRICLGTSANLRATGGSIYKWSPVLYLNNTNIANPLVQSPGGTMRYIVEVRDVLGCPKPAYDTVVVSVLNLVANAGPRDTVIVVGQPLQLNGTGGEIFRWTPATGLSDPNIPNPRSTGLTTDIDYVLTVTNDINCRSTDTISVKVFNVEPDLYVPGAFTPDGDGLNETFRPIPIGMRSIDAFKVYNRWGQLIYSEKITNTGWDGRFKGILQDAGTYVWYAEGVTYLGKKITKKGSVILIK